MPAERPVDIIMQQAMELTREELTELIRKLNELVASKSGDEVLTEEEEIT